MLSVLAGFHATRYADRGGSTAFSSPSVMAFHEDVTCRALDSGWLRMYALRLDDSIAAVLYGFNYGDRFYFYQHGFDDRYKAHSVGLVLMALSVRAALDEGAQTTADVGTMRGSERTQERIERVAAQVHDRTGAVGCQRR